MLQVESLKGVIGLPLFDGKPSHYTLVQMCLQSDGDQEEVEQKFNRTVLKATSIFKVRFKVTAKKHFVRIFCYCHTFQMHFTTHTYL